MKSELPMTQSHSPSLGRTALLTGSFPFKSNKITHPSPGKPLNRDLAWQVAPNLLISFRYAWAGVCYAYATQRNFRIHTFVGVTTLSVGVMLHLAPISLSILALTSAFVMVMELLNTALESVVDLTVGQSYHELAKITKDCAAGAVFIAAIAAVIVGSCLLVPPVLALVF